MANKYIDFDKFISEKDHEYITVKVLGREYKVEKELPAIVPVLMARQEGAINKTEQSKLLLKAADVLFGPKAVDSMCRDGIGTADFVRIIEKIFAVINSGDDVDDDSQELDDESGKHAAAGNSGKK